MNDDTKVKIKAATLNRLIEHLRDNKELQNIDLMNLAGFCRNCISKWMVEEAEKINIKLDYDEVRKDVYGMDYKIWKEKYQKPID